MDPADTDAEAREVQLAAYRSMTGAARVRIAVSLSEDARRVAIAGIAHRRPELDASQREQAFLDLVLGKNARSS